MEDELNVDGEKGRAKTEAWDTRTEKTKRRGRASSSWVGMSSE